MNYKVLKFINKFLEDTTEFRDAPQEISVRKRNAIRAIQYFMKKKNQAALDYMEECIALYQSSVKAWQELKENQSKEVSLKHRINEVFKW